MAELKAGSHAEYRSACLLFHLSAAQLSQIHSLLLSAGHADVLCTATNVGLTSAAQAF